MTCTIITDGAELLIKCKNESEPPYTEIKSRLRDIIWELYCEGYDTFYLNSEYGIPLWSAEIISALKNFNNIKLNIIIPYEEQALNWTENNRDRYYSVHAKADSIVMANKQYTPECYNDAEELMLAQSDLLIAFGDFIKSSYVLDYAKSININIRLVKLLS